MLVSEIAARVRDEDINDTLDYLSSALSDGTVYRSLKEGKYIIEYGQKERLWLEIAVMPRIEKLGKHPILLSHRRKYWRVRVYSKELYGLLPARRETLATNPSVPYIRAFFGTEGTVTRQDKKRIYIRISQKNQRLLANISNKLNSIGIYATQPFPSDKLGTYVIQIPNYALEKFFKLVRSDHPIKYLKYLHLRNLLDQNG